jgi:hypothetical protein
MPTLQDYMQFSLGVYATKVVSIALLLEQSCHVVHALN